MPLAHNADPWQKLRVATEAEVCYLILFKSRMLSTLHMTRKTSQIMHDGSAGTVF